MLLKRGVYQEEKPAVGTAFSVADDGKLLPN
jgi:hypothetical protein